MSSGGLTPGDPLGGGSRERQHESGLPLPPSAPSTPSGYTTPPPPGAGGFRPAPAAPGGMGDLVLASWGRRAIAAIIDGIIVFAIAAVLLIILGTVFAGFGVFDNTTTSTGEATDEGVVAFILSLIATLFVLAVAGFLYAPIMMAKTNGQTLGRMATSIRVIRTDRSPMTFGWAFLREVLVKGILINSVASGFTFGLATLLDYLWPLWDEENRALHDFLVQTRTVMA